MMPPLDRPIEYGMVVTAAMAALARLLFVASVGFTVGGTAIACPPSPALTCRVALRSSFDLRAGSTAPEKRTLRWQWTKGRPTLRPGLGSPTTTTAEMLCVYDANGLALAATVPPAGVCDGKPCWDASTTKVRYHDAAHASDGVDDLTFRPSAAPKASIKLTAKGAATPSSGLPLVPPVVVQLLPATAAPCFASTFAAESVRQNDGASFKAVTRAASDDALAAPIPSAGCGGATTYVSGTNADGLVHDGISRTFGVYLPSAYDLAGATPAPVVIVLHGGFGSGAQVFDNANLQALADDTGVVIAYPDGVAGPFGARTWNAGRCCGYAMDQNIDDVGFIAAMLDRLDTGLCVDDRRVFVTGMSNGAMLAYRLACNLSHRVAAVAPVAGSDMTTSCPATRPVPIMHIHGTADMNVPWNGGRGCGPSGATFTSVADSIGGWIARGACKGGVTPFLEQGDGSCERHGECPSGANVVLCAIAGGGHTWPGAKPLMSTGFPDCPFGPQSTTFDATRRIYDFFAAHPLP